MYVHLISRRSFVGIMSVLALVTSTVWIANSRANAAEEPSPTPVVYIVTGVNFPDALGVGPASALNRGPILMVTKTSIPNPTKNELSRLNPDRIVVVGGTAVISPSVESQLRAWAPVTRIAGSNRYETAALVSRSAFPAPPAQSVEVWDIAEPWDNPHAGDGFALELEIYVPGLSYLVISGQATFESSGGDPEAVWDAINCGVSVDEPDPELAITGSWRVPTVSWDNPLPACPTQGTELVDTGYHTVTLNTVDMEATTTVLSRNLIVTVYPVTDSAALLGVSARSQAPSAPGR
jgi:hypothetical protein